MHDHRAVRVRTVDGVEPAEGPHRRQAAEDLVTGDLPAPVDPARAGYGVEQREIVAGLTVQGGEHLTLGRLKDPAARLVTYLEQVRGDPVQ
jgi:hypothetical protein